MFVFNGFTQKANKTLNAAIQFAEEMGHTYIGSEHILLGLMAEREGIASKLLEGRGAELTATENTAIRYPLTARQTALLPALTYTVSWE